MNSRVSRLQLAVLDKFDWLGALFVGAVMLALYLRTAGPSLGGLFDSQEYQWTAYALDFAPQTGYPLYMLLGKLWVTLLPIGQVAYRMNSLSGVLSAIAVGLFYLNIRLLSGDRLAGFIVAVWLGTSAGFWYQASVAAVSPLHLVLLNLIFLTLFLWADGRAPLELVALCLGLSLAHHRSTLALVPAMAIFIWFFRAKLKLTPSHLLTVAGCVALPLLLYVYIPFTADPATDRGYIWRQILLGQTTDNTPEMQQVYLLEVFALWQNWLGVPGVILAGLGIIGAVVRPKVVALYAVPVNLFLAAALVPLAILPVLRFLETERYALIGYFVLMFWVAGGILLLRVMIEGVGQRAAGAQREQLVKLTYAACGAGLLIWLGTLVPATLERVDSSANWREYGFWNEVFHLPLEQNAAIVVNWSEFNSMRYFQVVERLRPDLQTVRVDNDPNLATQQVRNAVARKQPIYLTPSSPTPDDDLHYAALGPLLRADGEPEHGANETAAPLASVGELSLALRSYELSQSLEAGAPDKRIAIAPDKTVRVALAWQVAEPLEFDYDVRLRLLDDNGRVTSESKRPPLRGLYPTSAWQEGAVVHDSQGIAIQPGTPPGEYGIEIVLVQPETNETHVVITLPAVVEVLHERVDPKRVFVREYKNLNFGNSLELVGVNIGDGVIESGEVFSPSFVWSARTDPAANYRVTFELADEAEQTIGKWSDLPLVRTLPTSEWRAGDIFKTYYDLPLPADAPLGTLNLYVTLSDEQGQVLGARTRILSVTNQ